MSGENEARSVMRKMTQCKEKYGVQNRTIRKFYIQQHTNTFTSQLHTCVVISCMGNVEPSTKTYYRKKRKMFSHSIEANNERSE